MLPGCSRENPFPSIQIWILCYSSFLAVTQAQHTDLYLQKKKPFAGETHLKSHAVMLCHLWSCRKRCNHVRQVSCEVFASLLPAMIKWSIKPGERTPSPPSINAKMWPHFPLWSTFSCRREWLQACRSVQCDTSFPFRMKMSRLVSVEEKAKAQSPCSNIQNHI